MSPLPKSSPSVLDPPPLSVPALLLTPPSVFRLKIAANFWQAASLSVAVGVKWPAIRVWVLTVLRMPQLDLDTAGVECVYEVRVCKAVCGACVQGCECACEHEVLKRKPYNQYMFPLPWLTILTRLPPPHTLSPTSIPSHSHVLTPLPCRA
jgi:hypothetical protein